MQPNAGVPASGVLSQIHASWRGNRGSALTDYFQAFVGHIADLIGLANKADAEGRPADAGFWVSVAATCAAGAESHDLAAKGYFALAGQARRDRAGAAERFWLRRSL